MLRGSLHGVARVLQAALHLQLQEAVLLPGCADGGHVLRPTRGSSSPRRCPRRSRTRPPIRTWIRAAKQIWKLAQQVGHERAHQSELGFEREIQRIERKLSERALTQRKARAREEPSPGPPASETDAGPPGHQPRGGAPARPRLSRGQEGPT